MARRLQEIHPALVHFPIALLPTSVGADFLGKLTGSETLLEIGRLGIALTAGSAAISGLAGLIAQESVHAEGEAHDLLVTHRTLNVGLLGLTTAMAIWRASHDRPSAGYLLAGLLGMGAMSYSAYIGGKMVSNYGVGVEATGGLREEAPEVDLEHAGEAARLSTRHVVDGARHVLQDTRQGEIAPLLVE